MLELNMNGKMLSDNDIVVLISKDSIQNMTEVKFFTDEGEVVLDDITAAIDININIINQFFLEEINQCLNHYKK